MIEKEIQQKLANWKNIVKKYHIPNTRKAITQILNSFLPFLALWVLMYLSLSWSYWITLALAVINAFFLVRIFIIQHDCGHQSFLKSRKWNNRLGYICSFFSSIPYRYWASVHSFHHAHSGQLETVGIGDIPTLTTKEYKNRSWWGRTKYRTFRHPLVLFGISPIVYMAISNRIVFGKLKGHKHLHLFRWQFKNNIALLAIYMVLGFLLGWKKFLLVQVPIIFIFGLIAFWFFYVQHQHEESYKQWKKNWNYLLSAIQGSTYYKLPKVFQWLTGNIGYHHIHHLSSRIPNYNLERCAKENPVLNKYVTTVNFSQSLKFMFHSLWDEEQQRMITFREYYQQQRKRA